MSDINFNNKYWQMFESSVMKLYLYAAYLDNRKDNPKNETLIRITAVVYKLNENSVSTCNCKKFIIYCLQSKKKL